MPTTSPTDPAPRTTLGNRAHFQARPAHRDALVQCFVDVLGCAGPMALPARGQPDAILAFHFPAGGSISVDLTDDALDAEQARRGAWLELRAPEPRALEQRVLDAGLERVHYEATGGFYFAAPGGQVFAIVQANP
jgi:hypothetical protein